MQIIKMCEYVLMQKIVFHDTVHPQKVVVIKDCMDIKKIFFLRFSYLKELQRKGGERERKIERGID